MEIKLIKVANEKDTKCSCFYCAILANIHSPFPAINIESFSLETPGTWVAILFHRKSTDPIKIFAVSKDLNIFLWASIR